LACRLKWIQLLGQLEKGGVMPKINLTVSDEMMDALRKQSDETGTPMAELIRRAVARDLKIRDNLSWGGHRPTAPQAKDGSEGRLVAVRVG
jgi:hypothetical protein